MLQSLLGRQNSNNRDDNYYASSNSNFDPAYPLKIADHQNSNYQEDPVETKFQFTLSRCCALTLLIAAIWYEVLPNLATVRVITTSLGDKSVLSAMPPAPAFVHRA